MLRFAQRACAAPRAISCRRFGVSLRVRAAARAAAAVAVVVFFVAAIVPSMKPNFFCFRKHFAY